MSDHEKLGILILRLIAVLAVGMGFLGLAYHSLVSAIGPSLLQAPQDHFSGSAWYIGAGILLFLLSRPLGRMIGRNLE